MPSDDIVELNSNQRAIVEAGNEPLLVVAGPGAGKTTVLKERISRLLRIADSVYSRILAITFTNVAASNLRDKLQELSTEQLHRVDIGTFHAFAVKLLQQHGTHVGVDAGFSIVTEQSDREELLSVATAAAGVPTAPDTSLLPLLSRLYERCPDSAMISDYVDQSSDVPVVSAVFDAYIAVSTARAQLDFPLLVFLVNRLLSKYPVIARQVRKLYQYICVDEFQDTNDAQFRLLSLVAGNDPSGFLFLADQDQVIYQWNGASPKRLMDAKELFNMSVLVLPTSFRCPDEIIAAANELISHNAGRFVQPSFDSAVSTHGAIRVVRHATERDEAKWLADELRKLSTEELSDTAVLARTKKLADQALNVARAQGVSAESPTQRFEFVSAPLVVLHSLLRLASRSVNERRLRQLCSAFNLLTGATLDADTILAEADAQDASPLQLFLALGERADASPQFEALWKVLRLELLSHKEFRNVSGPFFAWIESSSMAERAAALADYAGEKDVWLSLERQHTGLQSERVTLEEFLRRIDLESKLPPLPNCVRFMTVHGAKGLEYGRVYIIGAAEDQFPSFQALRAGPNSDLMQEERRSFFVAITRCKNTLTLSYAERYNGFPKKPSRFIGEMGLEL